jgi:glutathione reductase (NADPH)
MTEVDFFVIGAGSGGVRAARMAASYGAKVAIAEDRYMGGTCVNVGCIPKKLYSIASHYHYDFQDSHGFGWDLPAAVFNWNRLRDNKQVEIQRLNGIYENLLINAGVQLLKARAFIRDPHTVEVAGKTFKARYILLANGGWPHVPDFPGRHHVITSNEIFDLPDFPAQLIIIGGGYIAVEFASIFAGLGANTTLICRGNMPLKGFDEDIRNKFHQEASKHLKILCQTTVQAINKHDDGKLQVCFNDSTILKADAVLFATGRKPNTANSGLENVAIKFQESGYIQVDEHFQTSEPSIYAIGDIVGRQTLTPVALGEGMQVANYLFGDKSRRLNYDNIPTSVFSHPNIATVGLTEAQAREKFTKISIYESDFRQLRHTITGRNERTYMKLVVDTISDRVVGMHMLGAEAGEIIQGFATAINCGLTKSQLDSTLGIHPTAAEEFVTMRAVSRN